MRAALSQKGIPNFDIFDETFTAEVEIPKTLSPQTIRIADTDKQFQWSPAIGTVLDAADSAGISLPNGAEWVNAKVV